MSSTRSRFLPLLALLLALLSPAFAGAQPTQLNQIQVNSVLHPTVRVATAAALSSYTRTGNTLTATAFGALASVDGVSLSVGDRLLLTQGAAAADNGIWIATLFGDVTHAWVMIRAEDLSASTQGLNGVIVPVGSESSLYPGSLWYASAPPSAFTLNTTALTFSQVPTSPSLHGYCTGIDGALTISSLQVVTRDMCLTSLHVTSTGIYATAGYRIFVTGVTTIDAGGKLGNPGNNASNNTIGAATSAGTLVATKAGGTSTTNTAGGNGVFATVSLGGAGGAGGAGTLTFGTGGTVTPPASTLGVCNDFVSIFTLPNVFTGGGGGGGGGGDASNPGGAGGAGGGPVILATQFLVNFGSILATGGNGGNANAGNAGGGGGGGGGVVWLMDSHATGTGTVTAPGGVGGTGHGSGSNGVAGSAGTVIKLQ